MSEPFPLSAALESFPLVVSAIAERSARAAANGAWLAHRPRSRPRGRLPLANLGRRRPGPAPGSRLGECDRARHRPHSAVVQTRPRGPGAGQHPGYPHPPTNATTAIESPWVWWRLEWCGRPSGLGSRGRSVPNCVDTGTVSKPSRETNVRVPVCAAVALDAVAARRGTSRDGTLRTLLVEHVEAQKQLSEDDRLTHVSTLLRYPLHRKKQKLFAEYDLKRAPLTDYEVKTIPVRLRVDQGTVEEARSLAFRLPGQPLRRGPGDYQARLLTDAVMTAIARAEPFDDLFLADLLPLVRQRAALELWHLVVDLTLTRAEREALARAGFGGREERTAELLRDDEEAWHHEQRLRVLRWFARQALRKGDGVANEALLCRGRRSTGMGLEDALEDLGSDLRGAADNYTHALIGDVKVDWHPIGQEGRGGTAVWRAFHRAALEEVPAWLADGANSPLQIEPDHDGWALSVPDGWHSLVRYTRLTALPAPWAQHVAAGRVLELEHGRWRVLWPVTADEQPVGRLDTAFSRCPPEVAGAQRVELLLLESRLPVRVAPRTAVGWGLLTQSEAATVSARAVELTQSHMRKAIGAAARRLTADAVADLEAEISSYAGFAKACARHGVPFKHRHDPYWHWPAPSLAVAMGDPTISDAALSWLGRERVRSWRNRLREAEHAAWRRAIGRFRWRLQQSRPSM